MASYLGFDERIKAAISLGESHFREFKSALEGIEGQKTPRSSKSIRKDIGETLVAFANADGGELLIGVEDDGTITGVPHPEKDIQGFFEAPTTQVLQQTPLPQPLRARIDIEGKKVLYFSIEKSTRQVHLTCDGRCLQRRDRETIPVASEQIRFERQEQISREYDRQFVDGANVAALNLELLSRVRDEIAPGFSYEKLLQLLGLADFSGTSVRIRRAALLLFADDVRRWHPRCEVRILRVEGNEVKAGKDYNVSKDKVISGSIFSLISQTWEALRPHLVQTKFVPGGIFEEQIMYPEDACREALTNAIAHRDYSIEGRGIEVFVYEDRMEVRSPGALLSNVSIAELKKLKGLHESRNVLVSRSLRELGYMREMGEGLMRIYRLMKDHDLVEPELKSDLESFTIVLHHKSVFPEDAQRWIDAFDRMNLTREEKKIVLMGKDGASFSPKQVWDALDIVDTEYYRSIIEGLRVKGILYRSVSKTAQYAKANKRGIPVKRVPCFKIRSPSECAESLAELMKAFQGVEPEEKVSNETVGAVLNLLSPKNPYRYPADLVKAMQLLGLIDQDRHPLGTLRSLWESSVAQPKITVRKPYVSKRPIASHSPAVLEEENELVSESQGDTLYVGNLGYDVTESDLKELFSKLGNVRSIFIPKDFYTGQSRGFAFVQLGNSIEVMVAIETLDGRAFRGSVLRLNWARKQT